MSNFPAIKATTRLYVPGSAPTAFANSLSGRTVGFRRGNRVVNPSLSMSFDFLTENKMLEIKNHYLDQGGTFNAFLLSPEIWADHVSPPIPLISNFAWRYNNAPIITDVAHDRFSISVQLVAQPLEPKSARLAFDGRFASPTPLRRFIIQGGNAAATPEREFVVSPGGSA